MSWNELGKLESESAESETDVSAPSSSAGHLRVVLSKQSALETSDKRLKGKASPDSHTFVHRCPQVEHDEKRHWR